MLESKTENQIVYENETTGVFCLFETYESEDEEENDFGDIEDTNLCFNINYVRPDFFGIESFKIVDKLTEKFDLYVLDPQAEGEPLKYKKGELLKSWLKSNEKIDGTLESLSPVIAPTSIKERESTRRKLMHAGFHDKRTLTNFYALKVLSVIIGLFVAAF